ncbi:MAG: epoxyqueuosine reductase QueH [Deltaproteobacteria bacterium]|nr:epoxyqueuosine reductase QueH [Deltaproteobacteria bacterium]
MKILVHICCGPCSVYPIKQSLGKDFEVTGFFYNPNIHPRAEFFRRLDSVHLLAKFMNLDIIADENYEPKPFFDGISGTNKKEVAKEKRCEHCYRVRLIKTAEAAKQGGFQAFTSSLLFSRRQNHELIIKVGREVADSVGVEFYYEDFRSGWQKGIDGSKEIGLFRQNYCGCVFSFVERGLQKKKQKTA